jgi:cysteine desulfurase
MQAGYFDHNATTPLDPRVADAMRPWLGDRFGNPSSLHAFGQAARDAVERARAQVALAIGARPEEVVFTASGTEANNAVVFSCGQTAGYQGHLIASAVEHPSVRRAVIALVEAGMEVSWVPPDADGRLDENRIFEEMRPDTRLVCLMLANNEVGTVQPVAQVASGCRQKDVPLLCDAVQAVGKIPVNVSDLEVDYLTLGAHKFYGPLGAAALWLRQGAELRPLLVGGAQERKRRASTVNVPAVVGMGQAAQLAADELESRRQHLTSLRDRFESGLSRIPAAIVHGRGAPRLPNTSHVAFPGADAESLLIRLDLQGFAVSSGSACSSGTVEPSPTLLAMGVPSEEATCSLRVSLGRTNTAPEVDDLLVVLAREVAELRRLASVPAS